MKVRGYAYLGTATPGATTPGAFSAQAVAAANSSLAFFQFTTVQNAFR